MHTHTRTHTRPTSQRTHARTLAEDDVAAVEPGAGDRGDEELGAVGVWASVGHGEYSGATVTEIGVEFVGETVSGTAASRLSWVAALEHEALNYAVEGDAVVVAAFGEVKEVGAGERCF